MPVNFSIEQVAKSEFNAYRARARSPPLKPFTVPTSFLD